MKEAPTTIQRHPHADLLLQPNSATAACEPGDNHSKRKRVKISECQLQNDLDDQQQGLICYLNSDFEFQTLAIQVTSDRRLVPAPSLDP